MQVILGRQASESSCFYRCDSEEFLPVTYWALCMLQEFRCLMNFKVNVNFVHMGSSWKNVLSNSAWCGMCVCVVWYGVVWCAFTCGTISLPVPHPHPVGFFLKEYFGFTGKTVPPCIMLKLTDWMLSGSNQNPRLQIFHLSLPPVWGILDSATRRQCSFTKDI